MGADPNCGTKVQKIFDICKFLECRKWKNAKKEEKSRIISGTMDNEHKGKGVMSESNSDVTDEGKKEHKRERERNKTTRSPLHGRLLVVIHE